jgi:L,D-peptidoglycan transpeptidase YkuD (ErfK/YbiS/YcfS/YnhG family)
MRIPCVLGRAGISRFKREGDGATPAGTLRARFVLYRPDRMARPDTQMPIAAINRADGWCDDPNDRNYNRPVTLPYPARHERLWRDDHLYDIVVVLDWNMAPAVQGRGSAIFMHLARADRAPTEGCVAVAPRALASLLKGLTTATEIEIG